MAINWFVYILLTLLTAAVNYALMPKPEERKLAPPESPDLPYTDEGVEIPVVFGTVELRPFIGWYGGVRTTKIYEKTSKKG